ncbi:MAG: MurR/RpiR family transcriptional regulator [Candidatus Limivicinus sp.]|nr:MurR/RpiR family transcriptional regulator [Clostridiales bacterium]MDY3860869.1 MurR/RpiR family transcriptional regulator [Candidatus Limivicinus sp.]
MKNALILLQEYSASASPAEQGLIRFILNAPETAANSNIKQLSSLSYTSQSTIVRLCTKIGFSGYREFRNVLYGELEALKRIIRDDDPEISVSDSIGDIASKVTMANIKSLEETLHLFDVETIDKCVSLIDGCRTLGLFGVGAGLVVARDAYMKMLRINKPCVFNDDWHNQRLQAQNLGKEDLAIVISYSGRTREVVDCTRILAKNNCPIIAITQNDASPVAQLSSYNIYIPSTEQVLRSGAMSSRMAQMNVIDVLYTAYAFRKFDGLKQRLAETYIQKE